MIPARSHTFIEIDHELFSSVILLLLLIQEGLCICQLQAKVCAQSTGKQRSQAGPGKSVVWLTDCLDMTIAVDWDI